MSIYECMSILLHFMTMMLLVLLDTKRARDGLRCASGAPCEAGATTEPAGEKSNLFEPLRLEQYKKEHLFEMLFFIL